ncbi:sigma-70 family RNA polymerase sigma factor [Crenobacter intestini]|uniref:Sigma-70 family RNA polymerase sigma factor n=1 Tax=Crenobacter intestini TaxID=2563443 RepID=A0A4V4N8Q2_9NEIS|nr:sigma-70 family RNA polymerase sigma factor [Crenobacter intestini]TIC85343.1 sigma-70 family RNA polymerase sigma factor [Crenobacter intestini]
MHDKEEALSALFAAALGGDAAAYRRFLQLAAQVLRAWLRRRMAQTPDEVEDVLQEILLALHNQRASHLPGQPLGPWLFAIARYKLVDYWRRHGRRAPHLPLDDEHFELAAAQPEEENTAHDLSRLLAALPEKQREPIRLVKLAGLSVSEAAAETGMSESAVKVGIHRGLKALAALIRREK